MNSESAIAPRPLHWGLILPNFGPYSDPTTLRQAACAAEHAGYDSCWVTDHVAVDDATAAVYGNTSEALTTAAYVAAVTEHVRIGISALIVPQRDRVLTLKQVASLDALSGGRLILGVAAGWLESEFRVLRQDFQRRGARLDAWLGFVEDVAAQLPGPISHRAMPVSGMWLGPGFHDGRMPPIWVAGRASRALSRAARYGCWHPSALELDPFTDLTRQFHSQRPDGQVVMRITIDFTKEPVVGARDERGHPAIFGPPDWVARQLASYRSAGATGFAVSLANMRAGVVGRVDKFASEVMSALS